MWEAAALRRRALALFLSFSLLAGCTSSSSRVEKVSIPAQPPPAADTRPVIAAFGDSLTAGLGVEPGQNYPSKLQARINAAGLSYRVVNAGVSGDTSAQGLNRLSTVEDLQPRIVILELGANDGLRGIPLDETRKNLDTIMTRLDMAGAKVILAGMEMPPNYGSEYTRGFRELFPALAKEHHAALIPFFLAGVGGVPELNQDDGIHPTARGYDFVVDNVWKALEPLLAKTALKERSARR